MPIYEYTCSACGHTTDMLHGIHEPAPPFCPECGAEGTLRKGFAAPAIVFKGTGWAKKDRAATRTPGSSKGSTETSDAKGESGSDAKREGGSDAKREGGSDAKRERGSDSGSSSDGSKGSTSSSGSSSSSSSGSSGQAAD
jgi:putative FmdB family regulatory protein